jgi:hypothetical protein
MCGRKSGKGMYVYAKDSKDRPMNQVPPVLPYQCRVQLKGMVGKVDRDE